MHIVFVDTSLTTPPTGGAQTFLVTLADALVKGAWKVSVVTQRGPELSIVQSLRQVGAEVIEHLWNGAELPEERAEILARWANAQQPGVYVVSISPDAGWLALPLLSPNVATVSIAHNDVVAFFDPVRHYRALLDCAVGVSEEIHRKIIADCGVPPERARHIPYGVDPLSADEFASRGDPAVSESRPLRIGYVGRLEQPQKRVLDFVPLSCELQRRGVEFEFHVVGDGSDRGRLEQEFKRRALNAPVKFWGWLSAGEVSDRLSDLDVFLLMSDCEGLPVALLEAMGQGLAPVVSDIASGNTQLVHDGENGFVAALGDIAMFADRLEMLANDSGLLQSMKARAWKTGLEYSAGRMVERYLDCFRHVTDEAFSREHRQALPQPYPVMPSCKSPYPTWLRKLKSRLLTTANATQML